MSDFRLPPFFRRGRSASQPQPMPPIAHPETTPNREMRSAGVNPQRPLPPPPERLPPVLDVPSLPRRDNAPGRDGNTWIHYNGRDMQHPSSRNLLLRDGAIRHPPESLPYFFRHSDMSAAADAIRHDYRDSAAGHDYRVAGLPNPPGYSIGLIPAYDDDRPHAVPNGHMLADHNTWTRDAEGLNGTSYYSVPFPSRAHTFEPVPPYGVDPVRRDLPPAPTSAPVPVVDDAVRSEKSPSVFEPRPYPPNQRNEPAPPTVDAARQAERIKLAEAGEDAPPAGTVDGSRSPSRGTSPEPDAEPRPTVEAPAPVRLLRRMGNRRIGKA